MEIPYQFAYPVPPTTVQAVQDVLERRIDYFGPYTEILEAKLAALCGVPRAVSASSGSACLLLALHACGVQAGEEVVMPANVYGGVPEAVLLLSPASCPMRTTSTCTNVVRAAERDALRGYLREQGVETRVHYTLPAHFHRGFKGGMPYRPGQFPVAEALCRESLSLPCNPNVGEAEIGYVVERVKAFYARRH